MTMGRCRCSFPMDNLNGSMGPAQAARSGIVTNMNGPFI
jgi:hypothetical protein